MTDTDLFAEAAAELYSSDPDQFIERRGALAAQARAAGQAPAAKRIAGLRKPTRSAWVLNQLVRAAPGVPSDLSSLGEELRSAQRSLDGAAIRELSVRRHQLIENLARQAFTVAGLRAPPAALRDEVTATLGAAVADPEVAEQLAAGTLDRAARTEGFGPGPPTLTLVTSSGGRRPVRGTSAVGPSRGPRGPRALAVAGAAPATGPAAKAPAAPPGAAPPAESAGAERERRRLAAVAAAEQALAEAGRAAEAATAAEQDLERSVQRMEEQLADARRSLSDTRAQARRARARQRQARQALDRLRK